MQLPPHMCAIVRNFDEELNAAKSSTSADAAPRFPHPMSRPELEAHEVWRRCLRKEVHPVDEDVQREAALNPSGPKHDNAIKVAREMREQQLLDEGVRRSQGC